VRTTRKLRDVTDEQLAAMHNATLALLDFQTLISSRVLTDLCFIREEIEHEQGKRENNHNLES
jgi:hypothetical protein